MKRYLLLLFLTLSFNGILAQGGLRINLYSAYVFNDYFEAYADSYNYFHGTLQGGFQWGGGLEYTFRPEYSIELVYQRQDSHAPTTWQSGQFTVASHEDLNIDLNYILLAGNRQLVKGSEKVQTYGGLMAGVGIIDVTNATSDKSSTLTKFAWGFRGGVNIWASETMGVKIQAQLLSAVQGAGGGAYFGTSGAGVGVSTHSTIYQFSLGGGLTFKLGRPGSAEKMQ
jgi:hypothetical protein